MPVTKRFGLTQLQASGVSKGQLVLFDLPDVIRQSFRPRSGVGTHTRLCTSEHGEGLEFRIPERAPELQIQKMPQTPSGIGTGPKS